MIRPVVCVNCGVRPIKGRAKFFCGPACRELASSVRWARRRGLDAIHADSELFYALTEKLRFISCGGYSRLHRVTQATRAKVVKDAASKCGQCGEPGTEVDHREPLEGPAYNEPENLQLLCERCHLRKTWGAESYDEWAALPKSEEVDPDWTALWDEFVRRVESPEPLKHCDDEKGWDWFSVENRARKHHGDEVWNDPDFDRAFLVKVYEDHLKRKREAKRR